MTTTDPAIVTLVSSVTMMLKNDPTLLAAGTSGDLGFDDSGLWIFQDDEGDFKPFRDPHGTGTSAIVVGFTDAWGVVPLHTVILPLLQIIIYSDCSRGTDNEPVRLDQKTKALRLFTLVDKILHDPANQTHEWWGTQILSSVRSSGHPNIVPLPSNPGLVQLVTRYEVVVP